MNDTTENPPAELNMTTNKTENPPAFPSAEACPSWQCRKPSVGMTLRDYFAAKAITAFIPAGIPAGVSCERMAADAYAIADAMLKARSAQ